METLGEESKVVWWRTAHGERAGCPEPARGGARRWCTEGRGSPSHAASQLTSGTAEAAWVLSPARLVPGQSLLSWAALLPPAPRTVCSDQTNVRRRAVGLPLGVHTASAPVHSATDEGGPCVACGWAGLSHRSLRQRGEETPQLPVGRTGQGPATKETRTAQRAHVRWPGPALSTPPLCQGQRRLWWEGPEQPHHPVRAIGGLPTAGMVTAVCPAARYKSQALRLL